MLLEQYGVLLFGPTDRGQLDADQEMIAELRGLSKQFGKVVACNRVDLQLRAGEVHALLGENGAGKTTLMSMFSGVTRPDSGEILVRGQRVSIRSPNDASRVGIGMVHQQYKLVRAFTVAENLFMGWAGAPRFFDQARLNRQAQALIDETGFTLEPSARIWQLSAGEQQRVAILRTLMRGADILIFDEPTAVLTPQETSNLFRLIRSLVSKRGKTVVFISHKLEEVLDLCDQITILRAGAVVASMPAKDSDALTLARLMVGRDLVRNGRSGGSAMGKPILEVRGVTALGDRGARALEEVSLTVKEGEIVGIAGVAGNGQRELSEVVTGLRRITGGVVDLDGATLVPGDPRVFIDAGVRYIPEDRANMGLLLNDSIERNSIIRAYWKPPLSKGPFLSLRAIRRFAEDLLRRTGIAHRDVGVAVKHLSGGNQQRLLTGREIHSSARLLVAVHPTRGVDVGATEEIHHALLAVREKGIGVLLISEDLDEIAALSDRVLVMYGGRIVGGFGAHEFDREKVGLLMGGVLTPEPSATKQAMS